MSAHHIPGTSAARTMSRPGCGGRGSNWSRFIGGGGGEGEDDAERAPDTYTASEIEAYLMVMPEAKRHPRSSMAAEVKYSVEYVLDMADRIRADRAFLAKAAPETAADDTAKAEGF